MEFFIMPTCSECRFYKTINGKTCCVLNPPNITQNELPIMEHDFPEFPRVHEDNESCGSYRIIIPS